eukprot:31235_1
MYGLLEKFHLLHLKLLPTFHTTRTATFIFSYFFYFCLVPIFRLDIIVFPRYHFDAFYTFYLSIAPFVLNVNSSKYAYFSLSTFSNANHIDAIDPINRLVS